MKKLRLLVLWALLQCQAVFALSTGVPPSEAPYRIGVLYWSMSIPGQVAMRNGLEAEAVRINSDAPLLGERGVELLTRVAGDGEAGIENQIRQMYELVRAKVDLIVVQPTDNAALARPLQAANRAGIPVVAYDQYIRGGHLVSYITSDNYQAGYLDGEYVASRFADEQRIRIVLVEYPHVSSTVERADGFVEALHDQGQAFDIVATYNAVEPESGHAAGKAILKDFPDSNSVDVVFTVNDGGGLSVVDELAAAGRDEIIVASIDGDPRAVKRIKEGSLIHIDSAQFCGPMGELALRIGYNFLRGESVPSVVLIPVFPVAVETVSRFSSWHGPLPASFTKPWVSKQPRWDGQLRLNE
ncbi:MAG: sugar ABC transporter substrate-binding protein [Candidatus Thiodiazotropha sp.]